MPTYEYRREDGTVFEKIQGMNDEPLKVCPDTGQPVKRMISGGGGVVYKGTGFYVTDYKNGGKNGSSESKSESSAKESASASSNGKSD
ncbi:MAG: zinc ribbon domain-containing protein [Balneolaceae bacterium]|nr:zinc ribbon domain-containing protein [Balneolaceae bacterium]MCH8549843.1 zinc ribbon domain-containing protein [Balneolaceae bacterium]